MIENKAGVPEWLKGVVEELSLATLLIEPSYQRGLKAHRLRIAKKFLPEAVGTLLVGRRADVSCWLVDGQQRANALLARGYTRWPCFVFSSEGVEHESKVFVAVNGPSERMPLHPRELFKSRLKAGDPVAVGLKRVVESLGLELLISHSSRGWPCVGCVGSLYRAASVVGLETIQLALIVIKETWEGKSYALNTTIIEAIIRLLHSHSSLIDPDRMVVQLKKYSPEKIFEEAGVGLLKNRVAAVARIMAIIYNKQLRSKRLPIPEAV